MPHVTDQAPGPPPGRYGTPRRIPRWVLAVLALAATALLLPVLLSAVDKATPETRGVLTAYDVAENSVRATVDIHKPADQAAVCTVQARDFYSDVVGSTEMTLGAGPASEAVSKTFPTSNKAVVVEVIDCVSRSGD